MIGRLSGRLAYRGTDHAMIDVGGVGYLVTCSERTLAALPPQGGAVTLWTDLLVREDLLQLMGFATLAEKEWYRLLTTVQGVGARAALAILGTLGPDGVGRAIALGDAVAIRAAPGVGPKLAQRVAHELRDKAPSVMAMAVEPAPGEGIAAAPPPGTTAGGGDPVIEAPPPGAAGARADAMSALANLGYAPSEAAAAVAEAEAADPAAGPAALIRAALRLLAPKE